MKNQVNPLKLLSDMIQSAMPGLSNIAVSHKNQTVKVHQSFFYHPTSDVQEWADRVLNATNGQGKIITCSDNRRQWPKLSYFEVVLKVKSQI